MLEFDSSTLFISLEAEYDDYASEAEGALDIALSRILNVKRSLERSDQRSPFDTIESRIKTLDSVIEKCDRKDYKPNMESIKANVLDIAGIRIITPFRDDIYTVVDFLHHIPGLNVANEKDYVKNPKENGYSSYHMTVYVEIYIPIDNSTKLIPIEIQIRDKAMDTWATIEHIIRYKNPTPDPRASERLKRIAEVLDDFDEMAIELRDSSNA